MLNKDVELLLPAGDFEKMQFALNFGADAVYAGIPRFSLRARENGFTKESIIDAVNYAQNLNKKIYITANIIPHNHKIEPFIDYVGRFLNECQPNAWIMSDPGMIMLMKERFPDQEIHLSVQANATNYATVKFWKEIGVHRIILSRELSIKEIKKIKDACPEMEIEVFVHGAICIAYSGRCLISNYMSHRDPNQGTCSHSCRWQYKLYEQSGIQSENVNLSTSGEITQHGDKYRYLKNDYYVEELERPGELMQLDEDENGTYLMNARDLCAIEYLQDLYDAGVDSFKVEGRSKSVYYASMIARSYRWAVNDMIAGKPFNPNLLKEVYSTSNKGFISGFLNGNPGANAQKYDGTRSEESSYRFSGLVRNFSNGNLTVSPRRAIETGQELELCTADKSIVFTIKSIKNLKGITVNKIHGGMEDHVLETDLEFVPDFALLREKFDIL